MGKMMTSYDSYSEEKFDDAMIYQKPSSSILPLCITVVLCLIAGIVLGIIRAKRTINKQ